jgi:hypothetical protein
MYSPLAFAQPPEYQAQSTPLARQPVADRRVRLRGKLRPEQARGLEGRLLRVDAVVTACQRLDESTQVG